ncbi:zinc finger protein 583-like isoform X1 [Rhinatrema bivittatum]|uniref:zinc finger protein 583-like isoform X1 n=1 Tax=Rhinatrema bivittatum TaxID=194408 RepID=UPI001126CC4D|nr:zinc finger protein 583-like isoform X1 [Rhinatrema bivittatum]
MPVCTVSALINGQEEEKERSSASENVEPRDKKKDIHHRELNEKSEGNKMLSERDREETYSCSDWGKNCRNRSISKDTANNSPEYEQSASNSTYREEKQRNQTVDQRYMCDVSGIFLKDPVSLRSHQRSHTGERTFPCTYSGKTFSHKGEL